MGKSVPLRRRTRAALLHVIPHERPTSHNFTNLPNKTPQKNSIRPKKKELAKTHLENAVRLHGVHAQPGKLPTAHDLAPIPDRTRARPQRAVRPQDCAERRRRLQTFGSVDVFEDLARHGQVVLDRLLIRWMDRFDSIRPKRSRTKTNTKKTNKEENFRSACLRGLEERRREERRRGDTDSREDRRVASRVDQVRCARIRLRVRLRPMRRRARPGPFSRLRFLLMTRRSKRSVVALWFAAGFATLCFA